jgi:Na+/melibiose symporter-like transporter
MYYAHMMRFFTYITIGMVFSASMISVNAIFDEVTLKTGYGGRDTIISFPAIFTFTYIMLVLSMIFYALNFNHRNDRVLLKKKKFHLFFKRKTNFILSYNKKNNKDILSKE